MFRYEENDCAEALEEDQTNAALSQTAPAWHYQSRQERCQGRDLLRGQLESPPDGGQVQGNLKQTEKLCSQMWRETGTWEL